MPKKINMDTEQAAGAIEFTIGGQEWIAPEPTNDVVRKILEDSPDPLSPEDDPGGTKSPLQDLGLMTGQVQMLLYAKLGNGDRPHGYVSSGARWKTAPPTRSSASRVE
jgi:hypothetical protein